MFQGFRVCTQSKNKKLQTWCLKNSSVKHLGLDAYLGPAFSEIGFFLKIISNIRGYQHCQHATNWRENPVS